MNLKHAQPTIETVIKKEQIDNWDIINSVDFFKGQEDSQTRLMLFEKRRFILNEFKNGRQPYLCSYCKIPVKICGGEGLKMQSLHFRHMRHSAECIFDSKKELSKEEVLCIKFNGAKESFKHEFLKNKICNILENSINPPLKVEIEKVFRDKMISKEWRKPDVLAHFSDKRIAFELQISTTFVNVIIDRDEFYKSHNTYLIWIFDEFYTEFEKQTFSQTDILIANNYNVFVFDNEVQMISESAKKMYLKCYYIDYSIENNQLSNPEWKIEIINLDDLQYKEDYRIYYFDCKGKKKQLLNQIESKISINSNIIIEEVEDLDNKLESNLDYLNSKTPRINNKGQKVENEFSNLVSIAKQCEENNLSVEFSFQLKRLDDIEIIDFSYYTENLIKEWYFESKSKHFLDYVFRLSPILINFELLTFHGISPLCTLLYKGFDKDIFYIFLYSFFKKGYNPHPNDKSIIESNIKHLLKKNNLDEDEMDELEKHSISLQFVRLFNAKRNNFDLLYNSRTRGFILKVLSVLMNRIIGSRRDNFKSLTNDVISFNSEFSHLFIIAMHSENGKKNDYGKNGEKIISQLNMYVLNRDLDFIFPIIFPSVDWKIDNNIF